eukprot:scaffold17980_cov46-Attheya_sp.AAC.1
MSISTRTTIPVDSERPARGSTYRTILESTKKKGNKRWGKGIGMPESAKGVTKCLGIVQAFGVPDALVSGAKEVGLSTVSVCVWYVDAASASPICWCQYTNWGVGSGSEICWSGSGSGWLFLRVGLWELVGTATFCCMAIAG